MEGKIVGKLSEDITFLKIDTSHGEMCISSLLERYNDGDTWVAVKYDSMFEHHADRLNNSRGDPGVPMDALGDRLDRPDSFEE